MSQGETRLHPHSPLRYRLRAGDMVFGIWVTLPDPTVVEIAGAAGVDHVIVDLEHTAIGLETVQNMVRAAYAMDIACLVRVPGVDEELIGRLLDIGVEGIVIPRVREISDAQRAVAAVRYPPLGHRGLKPGVRPSGWGAISADEQMARANDIVLLALTLESLSTLEQASAFAAVPGVDLLLIGLSDLAAEAEMSGSVETMVRPLLENIVRTVSGYGVAVGLQTGHPRMPISSGELYQLGFRFSNLWPEDATRLVHSISASVSGARQSIKSGMSES